MIPAHPDTFSATELGHSRGCICAPCNESSSLVDSEPLARLAALLETAVVREVLAQGNPWTRRAFVGGLGRGGRCWER